MAKAFFVFDCLCRGCLKGAETGWSSCWDHKKRRRHIFELNATMGVSALTEASRFVMKNDTRTWVAVCPSNASVYGQTMYTSNATTWAFEYVDRSDVPASGHIRYSALVYLVDRTVEDDPRYLRISSKELCGSRNTPLLVPTRDRARAKAFRICGASLCDLVADLLVGERFALSYDTHTMSLCNDNPKCQGLLGWARVRANHRHTWTALPVGEDKTVSLPKIIVLLGLVLLCLIVFLAYSTWLFRRPTGPLGRPPPPTQLPSEPPTTFENLLR